MKNSIRTILYSVIFFLSLFLIIRLLIADHYFKSGKISLDNNNLDNALNFFESSSRLNPFTYESYLKAGKILNIREDYTRAKIINQKALETSPNNQYAYNNLGVSYKGLGEFNEAIKCFERALILDPFFKEALLNLGGLYLETGNFDASEGIYEKLLSIGESFYIVYKNLGDINSIQGDYEKAEKFYSVAYGKNQEDPHLLINYGRLFYILGNPGSAKQLLIKSIQINLKFVQARYLLAEIFEKEKSFIKAIDQYKIIGTIDGDKLSTRLKIMELERRLWNQR